MKTADQTFPASRGFNFAHELLCTTHVRQPKDLRRNKSILIILPTQGKKSYITRFVQEKGQSNTPP